MRTVICARDATDARHAALEHGIRSADMVLVDRTGRQLRGLSEFRVLVTDRFRARHPRESAEIWGEVRLRADSVGLLLDLPEWPTPGMYELASASI